MAVDSPQDLAAEYRRLAQEARISAACASHAEVRRVYLRTAELWEQRAAAEDSKRGGRPIGPQGQGT
jgi:hypothetical protein